MSGNLTKFTSVLLASLASMALGACSTVDRIRDIGQAPDMTPMEQHRVTQRVNSRGMVIPTARPAETQPNSLWRTGAKAFFGDQRASETGDIVTVLIDISDTAEVDNSTTRTRTSSEDASLPNFLGLESKLATVLPGAFSTSNVTNFGSNTSTTGAGSVDRSETVKMTLAAIVTGILPNGNMTIQGRQEVRINFEVRELIITGIIRPEDISRFNTILHTQIAEARISYGGRGQLTDLQQARWGQQIYEILFPF